MSKITYIIISKPNNYLQNKYFNRRTSVEDMIYYIIIIF